MSSDMFFIEIFSPGQQLQGKYIFQLYKDFSFLFFIFSLKIKRESHSDAARRTINSFCDAICNKIKKKTSKQKKVISVEKNAFCVDETVLTVVKALAGWVYVLWGL